MKRLQFLWILAFIWAGISCSDEPENGDTATTPEEDQIDMKTVAFTAWERKTAADEFTVVLATGEARQQAAQGEYATVSDGYTLTAVLATAPVADKTHPLLAEGEYALKADAAQGVWKSAQLVRRFNGKSETLVPDKGQLTVKKSGSEYALTATFSCGQQDYQLTYTGALIFKGDEGQPETEDEKAFTLNTVIQTQYAHTDQRDDYMVAVASGEVIFDDKEGVYCTAKDGYVMYLKLITTPSADPSKPIIPDGTYTAGLEETPGTWLLGNDMGMLIGYTDKGGLNIEQIAAGKLETLYNGFDYTIKANFTTDKGHAFTATFSGDLTFQGISADGNKLTEPVNTTFVGGQAFYMGADADMPQLGVIRLELYDGQSDPELGTVYGNMIKALLYMDLPAHGFTGLPVGTYEVSPMAAAFVAQPGYDDGVNIPTGTYIAQTLEPNAPMKLSMIDSGTIEITAQGHVLFNCRTAEGVSVQGKLNKPLDLYDLSGGEQGGGGEPEVPEGPFSKLDGDKVVDLSDVNIGYLYDYGDQYDNKTRNVVIQVLSAGSMKGFLLDLAMPEGEFGSPLSEGVYKVSDGTNAAFTFAPGSIFGPNAVGTWPYANLYVDEQYTLVDFKTSGNAAGGTITISRQDDVYTFTFDMLDDAAEPHRITGSWTGKLQLEKYDPQATMRGLKTRWMVKR